jgi:arylsulfatase A
MKRHLLFLIVLSVLFSCSHKNNTPPNIILIMADDLGYADIGCFGSDFIETPVLDKMASEGIKFTDYHSNGAVCSPTRAALMTGNYQQRAGIEGVIKAAKEFRKYGIGDSEKTLAEYFKEAGYRVGAFGKWHLGYQPEYNPTHHGFDVFFGYISGNIDFISHRDQAGIYDWWNNTDTSYEKGYVTDVITDHALEFMEMNKDHPFFIYLPHEAPHYPYQSRTDKADRLPGLKFPTQGSRPDKKQAYKEMVEIMDENIGRVMLKLKELNLNENTFVLFCSDNGATKLGNNGNLNGFKGSLWEGGHRVPAIAWYPQKIGAGGITDATVLSMDLLPALLAVAGISNDNTLDGKDFSSVIFEESEMEARPVFWRFNKQWAVRKGDWKYLKIKENEYLFNLNSDIGEQQNRKEDEPEKFKELKNLLKEWEREMGKYEMKTE